MYEARRALMNVVHIKGPWKNQSRYLPGRETYCVAGLGKFNIDPNCPRGRAQRGVGGELKGALYDTC